jgi:chromosome segregation ATPase
MGLLYTQLLERLDRVTTERDAARAEVKRVNKQLEQAISERTPHDYGILKEEVQEMRKQRDEARAEVEQWKWDYNRLSKLCSDKVEHVTKDHDKARAEFNRLTKERDNALAEVEQLKQALHDARLENSGQAALLERKQHIGKVTEMVRPEPSRLEIAAMAMQGLLVSSEYPKSVIVTDAVWCADKLIAAAKEGK